MTGSDVRHSANVDALRDLGATIAIGHDAANVGDADTLVVTGALWQDNPEYQLALAKGMPVLHRSQALAWLINGKRLVAVAGAHGKTTSTGMIVTGLLGLGEDPSFVNGGVIASLGKSSQTGSGRAVRRRGRRVGRLLPALRHGGRPDHQRRPRPPRPLRLAGGVRGRLRDLRPRGRRARRRLVRRRRERCTSPAGCARRRPRSASSPSARRTTPTCASTPSSPTGPSSFARPLPGRGLRRPAARPRPPQRDQRGRRVRRADRPRASTPRGPRGHRRVRRHRAPLRAARHRRRRERLRRLRPPPDRGRRRALGRAHRRRRGPHHRRAPAAPLQPHPAVREGVRRDAGDSTPTRRSCSTSTVPARTRSPA